MKEGKDNADNFAALYNELDTLDRYEINILILIATIKRLYKKNSKLIQFAAMYSAFLLFIHLHLHQTNFLGFLAIECGGALAITLILSTLIAQPE